MELEATGSASGRLICSRYAAVLGVGLQYIKRNEHLIDSYIVLDVIPGSHGQQEWRSDQIEFAAEQSYRNLR